MDYKSILKNVSEYVSRFYIEHKNDRLFYHNLFHTQQLIKDLDQINSFYHLDEKNYFIVCTAAWFHDTGILLSGLESHELKSTQIAENFLKTYSLNQETINEIKKCIFATQMPQHPDSQLENIICDADLFNLGTDSFFKNNLLVRKETEAFTNRRIEDKLWQENTIALLENHHYHTEFCQTLLNKTKEENLKRVRNGENS